MDRSLIDRAVELLEKINPEIDIRISLLQRQLRLNYPQAARLRDELERQKIIVNVNGVYKNRSAEPALDGKRHPPDPLTENGSGDEGDIDIDEYI